MSQLVPFSSAHARVIANGKMNCVLFVLTTFFLSGSQQRNDRGSQEAHVSKSARVTESRSVGQNALTPPSRRDHGSSTTTRRGNPCYSLLMAGKVKKSSAKVIRRGRSSTSRISAKNQVTIPVEILREVKMQPGDTVKFISDGEGQISLIKFEEPKWKSNLRELIGSEPGLGKRANYKKEREEWDAKLTLRG